MKVLPAPVASWISARGRSSASDALQPVNRLDLAVAQAGRVERWQAPQAGAEGVRAVQPAEQRLGPVKREQPARAGFRDRACPGRTSRRRCSRSRRAGCRPTARGAPAASPYSVRLIGDAARASRRPSSPRPPPRPCRRRTAGSRKGQKAARTHGPPRQRPHTVEGRAILQQPSRPARPNGRSFHGPVVLVSA